MFLFGAKDKLASFGKFSTFKGLSFKLLKRLSLVEIPINFDNLAEYDVFLNTVGAFINKNPRETT